jgi:UDP-GlcNAc:undecaprenyl-phosphate GlcNAc-1-phosphate transferase
METGWLASGLHFLTSFALCVALTPCIIWVAHRIPGLTAEPRSDRWHKRPTALYGGIAIFLSYITAFVIYLPWSLPMIAMGTGGLLIFMTGLADDIWELTAQAKFLAQIVTATIVVTMGIRFHAISIPAFDIVFTILWIVGITNAVNILDNMDGLAAGISMVAATSILVYCRIHNGAPDVAVPAALLAGSCAGFWIYNFNPAKIFMGDCGSLFLGFTLACLTAVGAWNSNAAWQDAAFTGFSNLTLLMIIPLAVLVIPIFDTALVSFTRTQTGRPIYQGGRDHTSHRLVMLGYSERRTVITLMLISVAMSAMTMYLSEQSMEGLMVALSIVAIIALFFGAFLTNLNTEIYHYDKNPSEKRSILGLILNKKQILQAVIDIILISTAYITAYLLKFDGTISDSNQAMIEKSLPVIIAIKISVFWLFGLYRGQWRFVSMGDVWKILKAVFISTSIVMGVFLLAYRFQGFSRIVFVIDAMLTLLLTGGVRFISRHFNEYFIIHAERRHTTPILIFGAGDGGDLFLRELRKRKGHDFLPAGFIDDDPAKKGQIIHGVKVLGSRRELPAIIRSRGIRKVFIAILSPHAGNLDEIREICAKANVPCQRMRPLIPLDDAVQGQGGGGRHERTKIIKLQGRKRADKKT